MPSTEVPSSQKASTPNTSHNVKQKNDPAWGHCKQIDEGYTKVTMMCIYIVKNRLREVVLIGSRLTWS